MNKSAVPYAMLKGSYFSFTFPAHVVRSQVFCTFIKIITTLKLHVFKQESSKDR